MESKDYIVSGIEGAYAYLRDFETGEEICVAPAALPEGVALGSKVHSEMCTYSLLDLIHFAHPAWDALSFLPIDMRIWMWYTDCRTVLEHEVCV